jgi:hypothetical protein
MTVLGSSYAGDQERAALLETKRHQKHIESDSYFVKAEKEKKRREESEAKIKEQDEKDQKDKKDEDKKVTGPDPKKSGKQKTSDEKLIKVTHNPEQERAKPQDDGYGDKHNGGDMTGTRDHMIMQE